MAQAVPGRKIRRTHPFRSCGRLCDSKGGPIDPNPKSKIGGMIDGEPPDTVQQQGSVGGVDQNDNPPNGLQKRSPSDFLPDFDDVGEPPDGVPQVEETKGEEIIASPITPEAQITQIEADNQLTHTIHADEQMRVDRALAQQPQESHSVTVPCQ